MTGAEQAAPPVQFTAALLGMALVFLLWPRAAPYLGAALVLGALLKAEADAAAIGINGPLTELGHWEQRRGAGAN
jgi:cytochrome c biogenesis protein CcdA